LEGDNAMKALWSAALLLAGISAPAAWPAPGFAPAEGYLASERLPDAVEQCLPGAICATARLLRHGCFFVDAASQRVGGSPLAIDATESGPSSPTTVYWINNTNRIVIVRQAADAYYRCLR
jgi:hypothetical protein